MAEPAPEMTRSQRRAQRTLRSLLAAGEEVFGDAGFQAVTIADITEKADVALGSFYNYFENREALIDALLEEAYTSQLELSRICADNNPDPARRITASIASQIHRSRLDPRWAALCDTAAVVRRWPHPEWRRRAVVELEKGRADGIFDFVDPEWTAEMVLIVSRTVFDPAVRARDWSLDDELNTILSSLFQLTGATPEVRAREIAWAQTLPIDLDLVARVREGDPGLS